MWLPTSVLVHMPACLLPSFHCFQFWRLNLQPHSREVNILPLSYSPSQVWGLATEWLATTSVRFPKTSGAKKIKRKGPVLVLYSVCAVRRSTSMKASYSLFKACVLSWNTQELFKAQFLLSISFCSCSLQVLCSHLLLAYFPYDAAAQNFCL